MERESEMNLERIMAYYVLAGGTRRGALDMLYSIPAI